MSDTSNIAKTAGIVGSATLLSRVLGFVRDMCIAWFFGAGVYSDAFFVAFRIPNLLRRLFAEGSLSIAVVSVFTQYLVKKGRTEACQYAGSLLKLLSVVLVLVTLAGIAASPWIVRAMAPGFTADPEKLELTIFMTRIMFPYLIFIGLVACCMGILNVLGHFAAPAFSPVLLNMAMIGSVLWISPHLDEPITGLCIGVVLGGFLQLGLQIPFIWKKRLRVFRKTPWLHPGVKTTGKLMIPMVFGAAVYQFNIVVGAFLASFLEEGSISYLYYADRIIQFPLGIVAAAASTAVLPVLARQAVSNDHKALKDTFCSSLKLVFFITIPAMVGIIVLREPMVTLFFQRGEFGAAAAQRTAEALLFYGIGIWAFSGVRILISTYYALQDIETPVKLAGVSILVNIVLALLLMRPMGFSGIALSTALSSMVNFYLLYRGLKKRLGAVAVYEMFASAAKTVIGSVFMGLVVYGTAGLLIPSRSDAMFSLGVGLGISIAAGLIAYGLISYLMKQPEFMAIYGLTQKRVLRYGG